MIGKTHDSLMQKIFLLQSHSITHRNLRTPHTDITPTGNRYAPFLYTPTSTTSARCPQISPASPQYPSHHPSQTPTPRRALSHRTVTPSNTPASQHTIPTGSPAGHPCTRTAPCGTPLPLRSCKSPTATNKPHVHERTEPLSPDVNGLPQKTAGHNKNKPAHPGTRANTARTSTHTGRKKQHRTPKADALCELLTPPDRSIPHTPAPIAGT